jgi:hypothetical protein
MTNKYFYLLLILNDFKEKEQTHSFELERLPRKGATTFPRMTLDRMTLFGAAF